MRNWCCGLSLQRYNYCIRESVFTYISWKHSSSTKLNRSSGDFESLYIFYNMLERTYMHDLYIWDCDARNIIYNSSSYLAYARAYIQIFHSMSIKWILRAIPGMLGETGNGKGGGLLEESHPSGIVGNCSLFAA